MSIAPLDVLVSRLGLEPGELHFVGDGRASIEATAGLGRASGRLVLAVEGLRSPVATGRSASAVALADAVNASGELAVATLSAPTLAEALGGQAVAGLVLDLEGRLRPTPASSAVADAGSVFEACAASLDLECNRSINEELADLVALAHEERELVRALGRTTLGRRADGSELLLEHTPALPTILALLAPALRPILARSIRGSAALISAAGLETASVAATRVALAAADVVVAEARSLSGARHALELVASRAGARASAAVLSSDLAGLRYASGRLGSVRHSELARVLAASDPELAGAGLKLLVERARTLSGLGVPVLCALEERDAGERAELEELAATLEAQDVRTLIVNAVDPGSSEVLVERLADAEPRAPRAAEADLVARAHHAARTAGAIGDLAILPEPARALLVWSSRGWGEANVVIEGSGRREPWTVVEARLETGARIVRLKAEGIPPRGLDESAFTTLKFDSWGHVVLPAGVERDSHRPQMGD